MKSMRHPLLERPQPKNPRWPEDAIQLCLKDMFRIKEGKEDAGVPGRQRLKPGTTAMVRAIDIDENMVRLWVNPAIVIEMTYQELMEYWDKVPNSTELTF